MNMPDNRAEYGSEYQWVFPFDTQPEEAFSLAGKHRRFFASGRDAFRALLEHGISFLGWRCLWLPSYFCQQVVASLQSTRIDIQLYPDWPEKISTLPQKMDASEGHVLLVVNHFGLRKEPLLEGIDRKRIVIIEDHTHDPWSRWVIESTADWCVVSLRKTLPIPDGAVLWSPMAHDLPLEVPVTAERELASARKLAGMQLKKLYLEGYPVEHKTFEKLFASGEDNFASGAISGMSEWSKALLDSFPLLQWREKRRANHLTLSEALSSISWVRVLQPQSFADACPFSGILLFDSHVRREWIRERLIKARVYPAVLWPLDKPCLSGIPDEALVFSRRMLSIHCDMRYTGNDMRHIANLIESIGNEL